MDDRQADRLDVDVQQEDGMQTMEELRTVISAQQQEIKLLRQLVSQAKKREEQLTTQLAEAEGKRREEQLTTQLAEAEAKRREEQLTTQLAEAEAKRREEQLTTQLAEAEAKRREEQLTTQLAEAEAKRRKEDELMIDEGEREDELKIAEEEAKRREEEELKIAEEEAKRNEEEELKIAEGEAKRNEEEELKIAEGEAKRNEAEDELKIAEEKAKQGEEQLNTQLDEGRQELTEQFQDKTAEELRAIIATLQQENASLRQEMMEAKQGEEQSTPEAGPAPQEMDSVDVQDVLLQCQNAVAANLPEDIWLEQIKKIYPGLETRRFFLPPLYFNRVPFTVTRIAGLTARVTASCSQTLTKGAAQTSSPRQFPEPQEGAGALFVENPEDLQDVSCLDDYARDDQSMEACLQALQDLPEEPMFVITNLHFRSYLDAKKPDNSEADKEAIKKLPSPSDLPKHQADGEVDILVIHRHRGLLIGEVKSVGSKAEHSDDKVIAKKVRRAIKQLETQEKALRYLLKDLPTVSISKTVILPFVTSSQLRAAMRSSSPLTQELLACTESVDEDQAVGRCMCADDLQEPAVWWNSVWTVSQPHSPSPSLYERLVARFCGQATTVDIPTASTPRVVVRTLGQAVGEAGLRFSTLTLTPSQVKLLDTDPRPRYLYLQGPPGTGKTLVLFLGALQSALTEYRVVIVHRPVNKAVATLLKAQLTSIPQAAGAVELHEVDFGDTKLDLERDVKALRKRLSGGPVQRLAQWLRRGPGPKVHFIVDEVEWGRDADPYTRWMTCLRDTWPAARVWLAGLLNRADTTDQEERLPGWMDFYTLTEPLRCPPAITQYVQGVGGGAMNGDWIPRYTTPSTPHHTRGLVRTVSHKKTAGHTGGDDDHLKCEACADAVSNMLTTDLHVGKSGGPQPRDVWVLTGRQCRDPPRDDDVFVQRLKKDLPVTVVETDKDGVPNHPDDAARLALGLEDCVVVTHYRAVNGLERRVIFLLGGGGGFYSDVDATTRATIFLCHLD